MADRFRSLLRKTRRVSTENVFAINSKCVRDIGAQRSLHLDLVYEAGSHPGGSGIASMGEGRGNQVTTELGVGRKVRVMEIKIPSIRARKFISRLGLVTRARIIDARDSHAEWVTLVRNFFVRVGKFYPAILTRSGTFFRVDDPNR